MSDNTTKSRPRLMERKRGLARAVMLDAAERLLMTSTPPDFSMRALCDEAGVSFTTPFKYFGSKNGIIQALGIRVVEQIDVRYSDSSRPGDAIDRLFALSYSAAEVWLARPAVNRIIGRAYMAEEKIGNMASILALSCALWVKALGDMEGFDPAFIPLASRSLPLNCAIAFRGVMALWIANEVSNTQFSSLLDANLAMIILGLVPEFRRPQLLAFIDRQPLLN